MMDYIANYDKDKVAKVFKAGNSEAIRLYKKIPKVSESTKNDIAKILDEDKDLIWALKDL